MSKYGRNQYEGSAVFVLLFLIFLCIAAWQIGRWVNCDGDFVMKPYGYSCINEDGDSCG